MGRQWDQSTSSNRANLTGRAAEILVARSLRGRYPCYQRGRQSECLEWVELRESSLDWASKKQSKSGSQSATSSQAGSSSATLKFGWWFACVSAWVCDYDFASVSRFVLQSKQGAVQIRARTRRLQEATLLSAADRGNVSFEEDEDDKTRKIWRGRANHSQK